MNPQDACFVRAAHDAVVQRASKKFRENSDQVKSHNLECNERQGALSFLPQAHEPTRNGSAISLLSFTKQAMKRRLFVKPHEGVKCEQDNEQVDGGRPILHATFVANPVQLGLAQRS
jgi:hypothetical protein